MVQMATLKALKETITDIRSKGHFQNCQNNSQEYVDWCEWIERIKERLLTLGLSLSTSTYEAIKDIYFDWDDRSTVIAAVERIHALTYLIEDEIELATQSKDDSASTKQFETALHSYIKKKSIGNGGAGNVYLVERDDGDNFAIKILNKQSCKNSRKTKRFLREIAFCKQYANAPLVSVLDEGFRQEGELKQPFYVMPLYPKTLRSLMNDSETDSSYILELLLSLLSSLEGFYSDGHIHRDIKPENILYDINTTSLVLADFGVAHINEDLFELTLQTNRVERLANFKYAAPEQRTENGEIDHRTDQYAFGLIINEIFTKSIPQGAGYTKISSVSEEYSYLDPIVERMISQNLNDRYESISILLADIEAQKRILGLENDALNLKSKSLVFDEISIVGKEWEDPNLIFKLNLAPSRDWIQVFRSYRGTTSFCTDGFHLDPKHFSVNEDKIIVPNTHGDENHLTQACVAMPRFLTSTNDTMKKRIEKEEHDAYEALVREKEDEIRRREASERINNFLESL